MATDMGTHARLAVRVTLDTGPGGSAKVFKVCPATASAGEPGTGERVRR